ncbi:MULTISPECIES: fumarate hydratase [unclassified Cupriavidus]|uniref:fumarate hydratase n=1 Tax=unclassified Cupriavidus TaxID=2640874 RepID=UPI00040F0C2E|nr:MULTISPECIES: fumarate hydratase [unclassified Cupriavidus]MBP0634083.1 fumarate hydratase [Cupriavidus sp. AcVe19-6a]
MTTVVCYGDFVDSIAAALQFVSHHHPPDYIRHLAAAYEREASEPAKQAIAQILVNSRMCAEGRRPICQDTGIVNIFIRVGMGVRLDGFPSCIVEAANAGVRRAYLDPDNTLRASIVEDPLFTRRNTGDNTPAVVHVELVPGNTIVVDVMAKGGGSENKSKFAVLMPSDSVADWIVGMVPSMGAGWCPPGMLGIGVGGTVEKAMLLAKQSLTAPLDMLDLKARGPRNALEALRIDIHDRINALGIGAQGLGGLTTVLDVKIATYPTHAASMPVAVVPNCAATRHARFELDGSGPVMLTAPSPDLWPDLPLPGSTASRRVDLDTLTRAETATWRAGETLLLSGRMLTGRDAAHKRIDDMLLRGEPLPVDFRDRMIYYVGPVDPVRDEVVGPCGPTTSTRMDKFADRMLVSTGLLGMIGKAERGPAAISAIVRNGCVYLAATGGAAYLISKAVRSSRVLAFADLGMEAIYEFDVENLPVVVAVDSSGNNAHDSGPRRWRIAAA